MNIGNLPISQNAADWLRVRAALSGNSARQQVAKLVEREISKSIAKWLCDLEVAAAECNLSTEELWVAILAGQPLPESINPAAAIATQLKQQKEGRLYKEEK